MTRFISGGKFDWEMVIGIETHAQMQTASKLFSASAANFGSSQNDNVDFIDAAFPGTLPLKPNIECINCAIRAGLALGCEIAETSVFDRKNYFYPDLPKGYQITQYYHPIATGGSLIIEKSDGSSFNVRINRLHIEEDAGKSIHDLDPDSTFIDLNRSGIGLMEIVTEPDMRSADDVCDYVKELRAILRYVDACDGNMECGSMRCDINVSVRRAGDETLGNRVEIKNVNSIRNIKNAILFEVNRQIDVLENGGQIHVETRLFDADTGTTRAMRKKEGVADYRYFPEPNLLPLKLNKDYISDIKKHLPELPAAKKQRYIDKLGLSKYDAGILTSEKSLSMYFENVLLKCNKPKIVANWLCAEFFKNLNKNEVSIEDLRFNHNDFAELIIMIDDGTISGKIAKDVLSIMFESGQNPREIVKERDLVQNTNADDIEQWVDSVLQENVNEVTRYREGESKLLTFFVGQVMKKSRGKANPASVNKALKSALDAVD